MTTNNNNFQHSDNIDDFALNFPLALPLQGIEGLGVRGLIYKFNPDENPHPLQ